MFACSVNLQTLAEKEAANGRSADSAMTLEGVVPKKFSRKTLQELLDMSPSALQGLSARFAQNLESSLSIKSIKCGPNERRDCHSCSLGQAMGSYRVWLVTCRSPCF